MKTKLILLLFLPLFAFAQEETIISQTTRYLPYQDTLFLIEITTQIDKGFGEENIITNRDLIGPVDSVGVATQQRNEVVNIINTSTRRMVRAFDFSKNLQIYRAYSDSLAAFGVSLDSMVIDFYVKSYEGTYRIDYNDDSGTSFEFTLDRHPNRSDLLRATGTNGEGNFNVNIYGRDFFRVNLGGGRIEYFIPDPNSVNSPAFVSPSRVNPAVIAPVNRIRIVKLD